MLKIAVDGRALTARPAGVANFLIAAINNLPEYLTGVYFYIFTNKPVSDETKQRLRIFQNVEYICEKPSFISKIGMVWFQLKLPYLVRKYNPDYFWGPGQVIPFFLPRKVKKIMTICDVVFLKYRNTMSLPTLIESIIWTGRGIKNSDILWTISGYTKKELESAFPERKCRDIFVGLSIENDMFKNINMTQNEKYELLNKYKIIHPFVIFVGTLEPRKNLQFLLSLMPDLASKGVSLLIIGARGWKQEKTITKIIESPGFPIKNVIFTGYVPFQDLIKLYNTADLLVSVSLNEGYGLPIMEAAACGCPVICPDNSGMSEITHNLVNKIKGWDRENWIKAILSQINSDYRIKDYPLTSNSWEIISRELNKRLCEY